MKISKLHEPFNAQDETGVSFHRNFNLFYEGIIKKISYERRAYDR